MIFLSSFYIAFLLATLLVPVGIRLGRAWGIVDKPNSRKIHTGLIPRTGGLAFALAALVALLTSLSLSRELAGFLGGGLVILVFGLWDDMQDLSYRTKFAGQILAILVFAIGSGAQVCCLGELWPGATVHLGPVSLVVTLIFMLAVINIINLSDGLDGLAGGLSLLILLSCAMLGYSQETFLPVAIALAVSGGLVGFLRFNVHPAEVFMGDTGSQFLGYTIGACLIMLTQGDSIYTPVLPLFVLGTPILDTGMVMYERFRAGVSPFKPDKNHLHHKLLRAGLTQEQAVVSIYFFHFVLILCGFSLRYAPDYAVLLLYLVLICGGIIFRVVVQGSGGWAKRLHASIKKVARAIFVWRGRSIDVRFCLSWLCWKCFFLFFGLFFFLNIAFIRHDPMLVLPVTLGGLGLVAHGVRTRSQLLWSVLYYAMLAVILYVVVYGEMASDSSVFLAMGSDAVTAIFYVLSALYFGCIILTPEKAPLNALDFILLAFICFISFMPELPGELRNLRQVCMKAVLLGMGLNLIYSRIARNTKYVVLLFCLLLVESAVVSLL